MNYSSSKWKYFDMTRVTEFYYNLFDWSIELEVYVNTNKYFFWRHPRHNFKVIFCPSCPVWYLVHPVSVLQYQLLISSSRKLYYFWWDGKCTNKCDFCDALWYYLTWLILKYSILCLKKKIVCHCVDYQVFLSELSL